MYNLKDVIKDSLLRLNKIESKKSHVHFPHGNILLSTVREYAHQYLNLTYEIKTFAGFEWHRHS